MSRLQRATDILVQYVAPLLINFMRQSGRINNATIAKLQSLPRDSAFNFNEYYNSLKPYLIDETREFGGQRATHMDKSRVSAYEFFDLFTRILLRTLNTNPRKPELRKKIEAIKVSLGSRISGAETLSQDQFLNELFIQLLLNDDHTALQSKIAFWLEAIDFHHNQLLHEQINTLKDRIENIKNRLETNAQSLERALAANKPAEKIQELEAYRTKLLNLKSEYKVQQAGLVHEYTFPTTSIVELLVKNEAALNDIYETIIRKPQQQTRERERLFAESKEKCAAMAAQLDTEQKQEVKEKQSQQPITMPARKTMTKQHSLSDMLGTGARSPGTTGPNICVIRSSERVDTANAAPAAEIQHKENAEISANDKSKPESQSVNPTSRMQRKFRSITNIFKSKTDTKETNGRLQALEKTS